MSLSKEEMDRLIHTEEIMTGTPKARVHEALEAVRFPRFVIDDLLRPENEQRLLELGKRIKHGDKPARDISEIKIDPVVDAERIKLLNSKAIEIIEAIEAYLHIEL